MVILLGNLNPINMLTIIILAAIAIIALCIGFFEVKLPFFDKKKAVTERKTKISKEPAKSIEAFYRTVRAESWLYNIEHRRASDVA